MNNQLLIVIIFVTIARLGCVPLENYLLDSTTFQGELNWDKKAYGDSNELPGWKEQSFSQRNGDVWRVHFVCDISSSNPNNWLRLPFIAREDANRLVVKLEYTIRECKKYPGEIRSCKETFQLLYAESDYNGTSPEQPPEFTEANYKYLKTIAPNNVHNNPSAMSTVRPLASTLATSTSGSTASSIFRTEVELPLEANKSGVYLVFRDQGACVSLLSIKVYYTLCSAQVTNLVIFPRTPTGSNVTDLVQRQGRCIDNADAKSVPYGYCQTNGNWFITNDNEENNICRCRPGYFYSPGSTQCLECAEGEYKYNASNELECLKCPANSWSFNVASRTCPCLSGFFRLNAADHSQPCVRYPPEPKNLTVYYLDQTSMRLRWDPVEGFLPSQVKYKLACFKCKENYFQFGEQTTTIISTVLRSNSMCIDKVPCENYVRFSSKKDEILKNKITLNYLDSNSQYLIEIYAEHTEGLFKTKTVDIMVRTHQALRLLQVINITAYQFIDLNQIMVLWSHNQVTNDPAVFTGYELRYWPKDEFQNANVLEIKAPASNFTLKNSNPNVISNTIYVFQLRGKTVKGWAPYSKPIESIRISNFYMKSSVNQSSTASNLFDLASTSHILPYKQMLTYGSTLSISQTENLTATITIAVAVSLCFIIISLAILIYLSRSSRFKCLTLHLSKPASSSTSSDCDSLDIAKRNMAYNPLGACSAGTRSSGHSSPMWPPMDSTKSYIDPHTYEDPTKVVSLFARELSPSHIIIESVIGGGEFGDVCKGCLKLTPWSDTVVAIKTLKGAATEQNRCDFLTEASIMAQFNDPNVVRLEGVVTQTHPLMIVTEYMENGSLDTFLRLNENKLKLPQMIKMLGDVASGMRYLSDMSYIHRDLAARNILINKDLVCKVADFGLSREMDNESLEYTTKGGKIPIRWTAPEACNFRKYSYASDVWSFGVLAWEVLTFGERPYWNWENTDVIKANKEQYRLPPPHDCPDCLYKLMLRCWQEERSLRPKFDELVLILDEIMHYTDELRMHSRIQELLPINPRAPSQVQLTTTHAFLAQLKLEHHVEAFNKCGLANLSNLFQLDANDLSYSLGVQSPYEQKKILDELSRISLAYQQSLNNQSSYISYNETLFTNNSVNESFLNNTLLFSQQQQQQQQQQSHRPKLLQQQQQQTSIFQLIRTNSITQPSKTNPFLTANDLLMFSSGSIVSQANTQPPGLSHGFLV